MTFWQVRADMTDGSVYMFGVQAGDREAAQDQAEAMLRLDGEDAADVQVTEIRRPDYRGCGLRLAGNPRGRLSWSRDPYSPGGSRLRYVIAGRRAGHRAA